MIAMILRVKRKVVWGSGVAIAVLLSAFLFAGCGDAVRQGDGPAMLLLESISGANGAIPDQYGATVFSDVLTYVRRGTERVPTIFSDPGRAQMRVVMKDIGGPGTPTSPSANNVITLTRFRVVYIRADGRNTPGVDVPYPFDGTITGSVGGTASAIGFDLVRHVAKSEAPLRALIGSGGAGFIYAQAEVTFYGHDAAGNAVSAVGRISVNFGDWGDPE